MIGTNDWVRCLGAADCCCQADGRGAAVWIRINLEWFQVLFDIHKSLATFYWPEEAAPCHRTVVFRGYLLAFAFAGSALQ